MKQYWHSYDQGFFSHLAQSLPYDVDRFLNKLGTEIGVNLFDEGFKAIQTPFNFLEAIGIKFNLTSLDIQEIKFLIHKDIENIFPQIKKGERNITDIIGIVHQRFFEKIITINSVAPQTLVIQAYNQLSFIKNNIIKGLIEHTIQLSIDELKGPNSNEYHEFICHYFAYESVLQFDYFEFLAVLYPYINKRKDAANKIYHALFRMIPDIIKEGYNIGYFRAFDRYRNICSQWSRSQDEDYKSGGAYLRNGEDRLDNLRITFLCSGYNWENGNHKVLDFTFESHEQIRMRIKYAMGMLQWINQVHPIILNTGVVYCFSDNLEKYDKIDVGLEFGNW